MGKGLNARPGDEEAAYRYFESFSPLPGERCRAAWAALPEREKLGWLRRAHQAAQGYRLNRGLTGPGEDSPQRED